jgi:trehalose 6-phosphate phosphatase
MKGEPGLTRTAAARLKEFFDSFAHARNALLLLDYDGTLAPFRVDRFKALPWAGVRDLLNSIQNPGARSIATRIVFISGRPGGEVLQLLGLDSDVEVWGLHGSERIYPDGRRKLQQPPAATRKRLDELRAQLRHDSFGGLFEDKPNAAVMHWRGATGRRAQEIAERTRALFEPLAALEGLKLLKFESGLELRAGRDKGDAVEAILAEAGKRAASAPVAFLGDDVTDEAAFEAVNRSTRPHLSALVRRTKRKTAADVWLHPPVELKAFLKNWIAACRR